MTDVGEPRLRRPDRRRRRRRLGARLRARGSAAVGRPRRSARAAAACATELRRARHRARERLAADPRGPRSVVRAQGLHGSDSLDSHLGARPLRCGPHLRNGRARAGARVHGREPSAGPRPVGTPAAIRAFGRAGAGQGHGARTRTRLRRGHGAAGRDRRRACEPRSSSPPTACARRCGLRSASRRPSTTTANAPSYSTAAPRRRSTGARSSASPHAARLRSCR